MANIVLSDAMIVLARSSATRVSLEIGPRATIAFLYEVAAAAKVGALRLPAGRQLVIR
jgi:hypothetical protein